MLDGDDATLLAALRAPDARARRDAAHALLTRFHEPIGRLMRRMLGEDAEDCVQEALVDVFRGLRGFEGRAQLSTWVYRVALRRAWKCAAARSRARRRGEPDTEVVTRVEAREAEPHAAFEQAELARRFGEALQALDLEQRAVLSLAAIDGLGPTEIAEVLGVPVGTVHSRTSRARARLRALLGVDG